MNYYPNGFIVKEINRKKYGKYRGVDGTWWNRYDGYSINIDIYDKDWVDVCTNIDNAIEYAKYMKSESKEVDILFCCTTLKNPNVAIEHDYLKENFRFIGFDYAYQDSSYYSCVFFDLGRIDELKNFKVNNYGLLQTEEEIRDFVAQRNALAQNDIIRFEAGGFIVYKLWKYTGTI